MIKTKPENELATLGDEIIKGIQEKKGKQIVKLDLQKLKTRPTDIFIVCHGDSTTQVDALAKSIEDCVQQSLHIKPWHKEGSENAEWILLDYVDIVVHVFLKDRREFYAIEELWGDADLEKIEDEN